MERVNELEAAQNLALSGDVNAAEQAFRTLAEEGSVSASAALAEINAYLGNWPQVLVHAGKVIANPEGTNTVNVYSDTISLVARAVRETQQWSALVKEVRAGLMFFADDDDELGLVEELEDLRDYLDQADSAAMFPAAPEPEPDAETEFHEALAEVDDDPDQFDDAEERADHLFALAAVYDFEPGAVELHDRGEMAPPDFENAAFLAGALASAGRRDQAWDVVEKALGEWMPVEVSQIAPVTLLTHPALQTVMTPDRCKQILRTPRGS